jgi:hypothetical protein
MPMELGVHMISEIKFPYKVDVPNSDIHLYRTLVFEWYVVRCSSRNGCQNDMYLKRGWTTCSKCMNHLGSILSIIEGGLYDCLMRSRVFTCVMNRIFI